MRNYLFILSFLVFLPKLWATTYVPVPIKKQISNAHGVVKGEVINKSFIESENGEILTKVFIRADKWVGVTTKSYHLEVIYPGGQIGDRVQKIHGSPDFEPGEKIVLLLNKDKKNENTYWLHNLALGKFMIKRYGKTEVLINAAFPNHPQVGQIPLQKFYEITTRIKQLDFKERFKDKYEIQNEKYVYQSNTTNSRSIASVEAKNKEEDNMSIGWLLVVFGILGGFVTMIRRKDHNL